MSCTYFCGYCGDDPGDQGVYVEKDDPGTVFCWDCAEAIGEAFLAAACEKARGESDTPDKNVASDAWAIRELRDRLDALEDANRRVTSVWRLWLNDAQKGAINPGTFDTMRNLLGME